LVQDGCSGTCARQRNQDNPLKVIMEYLGEEEFAQDTVMASPVAEEEESVRDRCQSKFDGF